MNSSYQFGQFRNQNEKNCLAREEMEYIIKIVIPILKAARDKIKCEQNKITNQRFHFGDKVFS